jgi:hypothetical protein
MEDQESLSPSSSEASFDSDSGIGTDMMMKKSSDGGTISTARSHDGEGDTEEAKIGFVWVHRPHPMCIPHVRNHLTRFIKLIASSRKPI